MKDEELIHTIRSIYYNLDRVRNVILPFMFNREVAIFTPKDTENYTYVRGLRFDNISFFDSNFIKFIRLIPDNKNLYISCAKYTYIPTFIFKLSERNEETKEWFSNGAKKSIYDYDMLFDFDNPNRKNREDFINECQAFFNLLNVNKVCFFVIMSGKNFHFVIDGDTWGFNKDDLENSLKNCKQIVLNIENILGLKYLDTKGVGMLSKLRKCPFSLVEHKVCILMDEITDVKTYAEELLKRDDKTFFQNYKFKKQNDLGTEQNKKNFQDFLKYNFIE